jgi:hypothetical protein
MTSPMTLRNFGGIHQFVVADAADLARIDALDAARWAATSAPLRDLHCDAGFLGFVDTESKGRIRVGELLRARDWLFARLRDRQGLAERSDTLVLDRLDTEREEGKKLRHAAGHVIAELALAEQGRIKLSDVRGFRAGYAKTLRNGDGIVPPELVADAEVQGFLREVIATVGSVPDASGFAGAGEAQLDRFLAGGKEYLAWKEQGATNPQILPLAAGTAAAWTLVQELDGKIEEFFLRCDLLAQEKLTPDALRLSEEEIEGLRSLDAAELAAFLAASSFAPPAPGATLSIGGPVNPAFQVQWNELCATVLARLPGAQRALDRAAWRTVKGEFAAHAEWVARKPPEPFDKLEPLRFAAGLAGSLPLKLRELLQSDAAAAPELSQVTELEKLILYQRWLVELANNFVNFSAVYSPSQTALVEMGSMVIDGRRLEFCTRIDDRAAHKTVAAESLIFLVYAQITDSDGKAPAFEVVAPVTAGERGRLRVGKRGIFVDNDGKEWDATVIEIIEHGISIKEAALAPFRRAQKFVAARVESLVASQQAAREKALQATAAPGLDAAGNVAEKGAAPPAPAPAPSAGMQNLLIGGSLAFAAIGSALAYVVSAITSIAPLKLLGGISALVLAVAGISALLGFLKLRRRDMGLLFEASGWAINAQMKITRRIAVTFTRTPEFPEGTRIDRFDILSVDPAVIAQDARRRLAQLRIYLALLLVLLAVAIWYFWPHLKERFLR